MWMVTATVGGSIHLLDSTMNGIVSNGIVMENSAGSSQQEQVLITIDNLVVDSATIVVFDVNAGTFLETSGAQTIESWAIGKQYDNNNPNGAWVNGGAFDTLHPTTGSLMGGPNGGYFERSKPQYTTLTDSQIFGLNEFSFAIPGKISTCFWHSR
jgi:glucan 1,3-beta-glucosidase